MPGQGGPVAGPPPKILHACRKGTVIQQWVQTNRYVTGAELAKAGLAEMVGLEPLKMLKGK